MSIKEEIDVEETEKATEEEVKEFELKLTEMETGSGAIPVTWCLSPEWLKNNSIKNYHVLLSTYNPTPNGKTAEWRGYAKLSSMMTYVTFLRPGVNRISARLADGEETVKSWMRREGGKWRDDVISFPHYDSEIEKDKAGEWGYKIDNCPYNRPQDHLQVEIPGECFAPEPWEFEKAWVNWLWKYKSVDQCEFRKRRMFAYTIQPFIFVVLWVVRVIMMLAGLTVALRGLNWGPIFNPLNYDTGNVMSDVSGSYFFVKKWPEPFSLVFLPSIPLALLVSILTLTIGPGGILSALLHALVAAFFLPVLIGVGFLVATILNNLKLGRKLIDALDRWSEARDLAREQAWAAQQRRYQELMLCSNTKVIRKLSDLPKDKRTVRLKFQGLKSMVCRPYAK